MLAGDVLGGVLDVDSEHLAHFDAVDAEYLEKIVANLMNHHLSDFYMA
jgi:putative methionine-R-sulfoxide reductase with GAF domain